jgi:hypothetical protein
MTGVAAAKVEDTVREIGGEAREIGVAARAAGRGCGAEGPVGGGA